MPSPGSRRGSSTGFHRLVAQVVAAGQLQEASSLLPVSQNAATVLGPALAGLLIGPWLEWAVAIEAASFAGPRALAAGRMKVSGPHRRLERFVRDE
jgi:predicted MFS family arabinose efflux permease